jgi:DNA-binding response OmpR family regulator
MHGPRRDEDIQKAFASAAVTRQHDPLDDAKDSVTQPRLLLVDDDAEVAGVTKRRLERAGFSVDVHVGGFGLVNVVRRTRYDLILLDVNMPALGSDRLLPLIRHTKGIEGVRVVLLSSLDPEELRRRAVETQANGWISKSASRDELVAEIRKQLAG